MGNSRKSSYMHAKRQFCDMQLVIFPHAGVNPEEATVCTAELLLTGSLKIITVASEAFTLSLLKGIQRSLTETCLINLNVFNKVLQAMMVCTTSYDLGGFASHGC